ncbi:hypothetical protein ACFLS1_04535 [Verrucomicrobiota bacterium]
MCFLQAPADTKRTDDSITKQIDSLLEKMTLEEKVSLCHGKYMFENAGVERLGIPPIVFSDGPHGVRREVMKTSWRTDSSFKDNDATYLPVGIALASTVALRAMGDKSEGRRGDA